MELIVKFWAQLAAGVAGIVWIVRVEASVRANDKEIRRLQHQRNEDQAAHKEARAQTNDMLGEVRSDIKELLRRNR
ncbi:hypothetical protein ERN12_05890 [Rhodobacteraceae bacterium]|nr:hypothetical protein ERN12_05890 [Paracoccaceae bacterium]